MHLKLTQYNKSAILQLSFFKREGEINVFPTCSYERVLTFYNCGDYVGAAVSDWYLMSMNRIGLEGDLMKYCCQLDSELSLPDRAHCFLLQATQPRMCPLLPWLSWLSLPHAADPCLVLLGGCVGVSGPVCVYLCLSFVSEWLRDTDQEADLSSLFCLL